MPNDYERRNSLRHPHHDYTQAGAYFVTFCAHNGRSLFGRVEDGIMILNPLGQIADQAWHEFAERHPEVDLDIFIIMPNHGHVVLWIKHDPESIEREIPGKERKFGDAIPGSLSTLIGAYKSTVTQKAKNSGLIPGPPLWQRNFHDHIVRNQEELARIREYIRTNLANWLTDQLHPLAPPNEFNRSWRVSDPLLGHQQGADQ